MFAATLTVQSRARLKVLGAVFAAAFFVIPFKVAAHNGQGAGAALGLLGFVALLFLPWALTRLPSLSAASRRGSVSLAWKLALVAAFGNIAQGYAFETLHAGVAATFIQMNVLFVAVLGVLWLGERLSGAIMGGILLAVGGIVLTQLPALRSNLSWSAGVFWALAAALGFALVDLLSRKYSHAADPLLTNVLRSAAATVLLALIPGALSQLLAMSGEQLLACALAALLGPGIARYWLISASRELPAVESALLQQARPLLALPLSSLFFDHWPSAWEWLGCATLTCGIAAPFLLRWRKMQQQPQQRRT